MLNDQFDFRYHRNLAPVLSRSDFELNERFRFNGEVKDLKAKKLVEELKDGFFKEKILFVTRNKNR